MSGELGSRLLAADLPAKVAAAMPGGTRAWVVGGAVRDVALGRAVGDLDLAVEGDPRDAARALASALDGAPFELSAQFPTWRVVLRDGGQVDLAALRGAGIEEDLALRDFTVGAVAVALPGGEVLDPRGGLADLERGLIRAAGPGSFEADPLRILRAARLVSQFGWQVEDDTAALARASSARAGESAGERQLAELAHLLAGRHPVEGLEALRSFGGLSAILPETAESVGVEQGPNHHRDVYGHTLEVLGGVVEIEADLPRFVGGRAAETESYLAQPLADGLDRSTALRFGALFHDVAKPATRREMDGFVTFIGHDHEGAVAIEGIMRRLKASNRLSRHVAALAAHHLRLGFMVHDMPLTRRQVHAYIRATEPVTIDVTLLTVADRLGARGSGPVASDDIVARHLELAREMVGHGLDWIESGPPPRLLPGDQLARRVGIEPGPGLGELLGEVEAAQYAGEVGTPEEAVEAARAFLADD